MPTIRAFGGERQKESRLQLKRVRDFKCQKLQKSTQVNLLFSICLKRALRYDAPSGTNRSKQQTFFQRQSPPSPFHSTFIFKEMTQRKTHPPILSVPSSLFLIFFPLPSPFSFIQIKLPFLSFRVYPSFSGGLLCRTFSRPDRRIEKKKRWLILGTYIYLSFHLVLE